ncbi:hypothetical protein BH10PSE1_BH10PSE1_11210 [soil metagenome]
MSPRISTGSDYRSGGAVSLGGRKAWSATVPLSRRSLLIGGAGVAAISIPGVAIAQAQVLPSEARRLTETERRQGRRDLDAAPRNKTTYAVEHGVVADGRTDDTAAMRAAYAAAADVQGVSDLALPAGVIVIDGLLEWDRGQVSVRGTGQGSTVLRQRRRGTGALLIRKPTRGNLSNVSLTGLTIDMATGIDPGTGVGIRAEAIINLSLTDVAVSGFQTNCVLAGCFDTSGHNCDFIGAATAPSDRIGLHITQSLPDFGGAHGGNIKFTSAESRTVTGLQGRPGLDRCLVIDACDGAFFDGCYFGYSKTSAVVLRKLGALVTGVTFANCWFDAFEGVNVLIEGQGGPANGAVKFIGCTWVGGVRVERNLVVGGDWTDVSVTGGSMQWATADNAYFGPGTSRIAISGLSVALADSDNAGGGDGIYCDGASVVDIEVLIDGKGHTETGVRVTGGRAVRVAGVITGCARAVLTEGDLDYYRIDVVAWGNSAAPAIVDSATGAHKTVTAGAW